MVQRYSQGQLASPVTGTPGIDQSAGLVEKQIAASAQQMQTQELQAQASERALNIQNLQQSEQNFNQATAAFNYISQQAELAQRRQAALDKAQEDEQRRLQAQFDRIDEDDRMSSFVGGLKQKYADAPQKAIEDFQSQVPVMRQEFQDRHKDDQQKLRMLMPSQRAAEHSSLSDLQTWARETKTQNLGKKLALMPEQLSNKIDALGGNMMDQMKGYQKALKDINGVYDFMRLSTFSQADHDEIYTKQLKLNHDAAKQFATHLINQTPEGEEGLGYLDGLKTLLDKPLAAGINLSAGDHKDILESLHSQRNAQEKVVITDIQTDGLAERTGEDARLRVNLIKHANDPAAMHQISLQVQSKLKNLDDRIAAVNKEPDSTVKKQKLSSLNSTYSALVSTLGQELGQQRQLDSIQRTLMMTAQIQADRQQRIEEKLISTQQKAVDEAKNAQKEVFNASWADTLKSLQAAYAEPAGLPQQQKINKIVTEALPKLDGAVSAGIISPESFKSYNDQLNQATKDGAASKTAAPWKVNVGGQDFTLWSGGTTKLKGAELKKAQDAAEAQLAGVRALQQEKFSSMQDAVSQLSMLTTSKLERTALTQYLTSNLPKLFDSDGYKKMPKAGQTQLRAKVVKDIVEQYRKGQLK